MHIVLHPVPGHSNSFTSHTQSGLLLTIPQTYPDQLRIILNAHNYCLLKSRAHTLVCNAHCQINPNGVICPRYNNPDPD